MHGPLYCVKAALLTPPAMPSPMSHAAPPVPADDPVHPELLLVGGVPHVGHRYLLYVANVVGWLDATAAWRATAAGDVQNPPRKQSNVGEHDPAE